MTIKKVKKLKNLKSNDVIVLSVLDQNDAGVFSDRTASNIIAVVDTVTIQKGDAHVLVNGGYEFIYPKDLIVFYLGNYDKVKSEADALYDVFNQSPATVKEINGFIAEARQVMKTQDFIKNHSN